MMTFLKNKYSMDKNFTPYWDIVEKKSEFIPFIKLSSLPKKVRVGFGGGYFSRRIKKQESDE